MKELSFICDNSADASFLAQELELLLRSRGVPADAISLRSSSSENMDIGSVLAFISENATAFLTTTESVVTLATAVYEVATKYNADVLVGDRDSKVRIPAVKIDRARIEAALAKKPRPKPKQRPRA